MCPPGGWLRTEPVIFPWRVMMGKQAVYRLALVMPCRPTYRHPINTPSWVPSPSVQHLGLTRAANIDNMRYL